jgi:hypothetical protein
MTLGAKREIKAAGLNGLFLMVLPFSGFSPGFFRKKFQVDAPSLT